MTIVVTAKVTDGIVLAADSAGSFFDDAGAPIKIYNNANKIFNLRKVWPIGALIYGAGGIGASSIETLSKDLRRRLSDPNDAEYGLNEQQYTIEQVTQKAKQFLFDGAYRSTYPGGLAKFFMGFRVCGYSAGASLAEQWEFVIIGNDCVGPDSIQGQQEFGMRWAGENEPLDRLILGTSADIKPFLVEKGLPEETIDETYHELIRRIGTNLVIPAMPIQDAIEVAKFAVDTATKFARYGPRPETIGGPTELAAITKHEGFKWVARKHYYTAELNRETNHGR